MPSIRRYKLYAIRDRSLVRPERSIQYAWKTVLTGLLTSAPYRSGLRGSLMNRTLRYELLSPYAVSNGRRPNSNWSSMTRQRKPLSVHGVNWNASWRKLVFLGVVTINVVAPGQTSNADMGKWPVHMHPPWLVWHYKPAVNISTDLGGGARFLRWCETGASHFNLSYTKRIPSYPSWMVLPQPLLRTHNNLSYDKAEPVICHRCYHHSWSNRPEMWPNIS